jgi:hypothetical protein
MKMNKIFGVLFAIMLFTLAADACPLCQAGATKRTQKAYEETTAILALLPLLSAGGIYYWIRKQGKK